MSKFREQGENMNPSMSVIVKSAITRACHARNLLGPISAAVSVAVSPLGGCIGHKTITATPNVETPAQWRIRSDYGSEGIGQIHDDEYSWLPRHAFFGSLQI